ncbi:hypothetical protein SYK_06690 [Pseudodesulfovibrio nedwellii]|uniref:Portal protein n=1 Tax=Pseudodesulfovibrio nedwellii TaxID=2973072 RepID=A0ABM8AXS6_9BACT|nr:hypothetical protein [Pseudodesulfovibrio nedwellii]BDQ36309.1 hypothetical protein SYK_06690 [Pseudodesulfovibrio nedwellii]
MTTTEQQPEESKQEKANVDALGSFLRAEFDEVANQRLLYEERWLRDLRQVKGVYDPEILAAMDPKRSKVNLRVTKTKVDGTKARAMDILFQANGEKNWGISSTPEPVVHPKMIQEKAAELIEQGVSPDDIDEDAILRDIAKKNAENMTRVMSDQLVESPGSPSYRRVCNDLLGNAFKFGTGCMKGPLVKKRVRDRYTIDEATGQWTLARHEDAGLLPAYEFVSIWNTYPDISVTDPKKMRFVWQDHLMMPNELMDLALMPNFSERTIRQYILDHPQGDAEIKKYETDLRVMGELETSSPDLSGRFRVYERWGYVQGHQLVMAGVEIEPERAGESFPANVWMVGNRVIKAVISPIEGVEIPYHFFFYDKDESSFYGNGIPTVMRDCQMGINASVRMTLDNAAIASGPQIGVNVRALADGVDPTDVHGWKVWPFKSGVDVRSAFNVFELPSHTPELMSITKMFSEFSDELTSPRFMQGDNAAVRGAGDTASGLSMLMGAASIPLKDIVKDFDDNITKPFIKALYHWNMKFNPREDIKGDFDIVARGSSALIAKEIQAQRMTQAVALTDNPRFQGRVKDDELLEEIFKSMDLDPEILRDDREYEDWQQKQMTMQATAEATANVQAIVGEMEKRGLDPQAALTQMLGGAIQQQQQTAAPQEVGA